MGQALAGSKVPRGEGVQEKDEGYQGLAISNGIFGHLTHTLGTDFGQVGGSTIHCNASVAVRRVSKNSQNFCARDDSKCRVTF